MRSSQPNSPPLALQGVKVVSLCLNTPGPVAAARLVGLGAEVTKVEPPGGDPLKTFAPEWYDHLRAGQKLLTLDLKDTSSRRQLDDLLKTSDLLLASFRPSAIERLGLDWPTLHRQYPQLCYVGITGYPGPRQERSGHDLTYLAETGLVSPPELPASLFVDLAGAERCVTEALALLFHRQLTGEAGSATVALYGCARDLAAPAEAGLTRAGGLLRGAFPLYGLYETANGWIAIAALEPRFAERLLAGLGLAHAHREQLAHAFRQRTAVEWENWAEERDLPIVAVKGV
ncbi:MAG TPA: CoA transferase [Terriglobales bacterium]|nr:CoA transferase [Terriglobales bacterium]